MNARTPEQSGSGRSLIPALLALVAGVAILLLANAARANCAEPTSYEPAVSGNTVTICPRNWQERGCPDPNGMLREDVATGAVVRLAEQCAEPPGAGGENDPACYVDECVPPGQYRYGFAVPYECEPASCGTAYFFPVTVADALADCQRTVAGSEPVAADAVPWSGDDEEICGYGGGGGGDGGCALTAGAPTPLLVFGAQALALLAGLGLLWARRARRARSRA
jgi:hypothetical protein